VNGPARGAVAWLACCVVWLVGATAGLWAEDSSAGGVESEPKVQAVATTGMVADVVRQVGADRVEVHQLMGPGVDPHLYKPTAADASALHRAEVIFHNGLLLEGRMGELFQRMARQGRAVFALSEGLPEERLLAPEDFEGHPDPHVWFDVSLWAETVPVVVQGLTKADPAGREVYEANGRALAERLAELHAWVRERVAEVPEERRILVTSHDAFNYFGRAYGFQVVGLQGVSTVAEASLADVSALVDFLREQGVPAIFVESSVNPAVMERVAREAGVRVGGELFSDAMGEPGEVRHGWPVDTYEGMVRANVDTLVEALREEKSTP
jgi:manganese/zinc/iron transport system substrate-binding protein